jgi:hypothetical protein
LDSINPIDAVKEKDENEDERDLRFHTHTISPRYPAGECGHPTFIAY